MTDIQGESHDAMVSRAGESFSVAKASYLQSQQNIFSISAGKMKNQQESISKSIHTVRKHTALSAKKMEHE